jgi:hypothetical protein
MRQAVYTFPSMISKLISGRVLALKTEAKESGDSRCI